MSTNTALETPVAAESTPVPDEKWEQLLSSCALLSSGPLEQYQLPTALTAISPLYKLRRLVHGTRRPYLPTHSILLVGETGAGKSTLVDTIVNYVYGVSVDDNFRLRLILPVGEEEAPAKQTSVESQTKWVTCYTIYPAPDSEVKCTLNIVDTPGFGDTGGVQKDQFVMDQMGDVFSSPHMYGLENSMSFICYVTKADTNRLRIDTKYIIDKTLELFGKDISNNLVVLGTHYVGSKSVLEVLTKYNVNYKNSFFFDNSWLEKEGSDDLMQIFYKRFKEQSTDMFKTLMSITRCSLDMSAEVLSTRILLDETAESLLEIIEVHVDRMGILHQQQQQLAKEIGKFDMCVKERKQIESPKENLCCSKCKTVCVSDISRFSSFEDMSDKNCIACDCPIRGHKTGKIEYMAVPEIQKFTSQKLKERYSLTSSATTKEISKEINNERKELENKITVGFQILNEVTTNLNKIALKQHRESEHDYFDYLIKLETMKNGNGGDQKIRELQRLKKISKVRTQCASSKASVTSLIAHFEQAKF